MGRSVIRLAAAVAAVATLWAPAAAAAPRAVLTSGPSGDTTATSARFTFEASGLAPLSRFECRLDDAAWRSCTSPSEEHGLTGGPHAFAVRLVGPFTDSTPDERRWVVVQRTELLPPPPPPPVDPPERPPRRAPGRRDAGGCPYGGNRVGEAPGTRLAAAVLCLVGRERRARGLRAVAADGRLARASARHARDMVTREYFAHVAPGGSGPAERVARTGYLRGARAWTVGEVLAWGVGAAASPRALVRAWMRSPAHRAVLLGAVFRQAGVGVARGIPARGGRGGATVAATFGRRD